MTYVIAGLAIIGLLAVFSFAGVAVERLFGVDDGQLLDMDSPDVSNTSCTCELVGGERIRDPNCPTHDFGAVQPERPWPRR